MTTRRQPHPARGLVIASLATVTLIVLVSLAVALSNSPRAPQPYVAWTLASEDLMPGSYGGVGTVDGTRTGTVLPTSAGWVMRVDPAGAVGSSYRDEAAIASVDPETGDVRWARTMPDARCTSTPTAELVCLRKPDSGSGLLLETLDPTTGQPQSEVRVELSDPMTVVTATTAVLTPLGDGLLAMTTDGTLVMFDADGTVG